MKLATNAHILTADGKDIGNLTRFVLDPQTKKVTHIVFKHGLIESTEYMLAMELLESADEQGIHLHPLPVKEVNELPRFELDNYLITNEAALLDRGYVSDEMISGYYYYPPALGGTAGFIRSDQMHVYNPPEQDPAVTQVGNPDKGPVPVVKQEEYNIPKGTVAVKEGAKVLSSDMKHLGNVEKIYVDSNSDRATHLLVTKGLLTKEKRLIPMEWVKEAGDTEVYLSMAEDFVKRVPEYKEK